MNGRFSSTYLNQLELLKLESRRKFLGSKHGGHLSLKKGHGIEFSDYRQYQPGDNPRYIDWKVYGRSDKLYVKRSQEDQDFGVSVFLDASPSMGIGSDPEKWNYACDLALSFAYLTLSQQDRFNLQLIGSDSRLSANSLKSFWKMVAGLREVGLKDVKPFSAEGAFAEALRTSALRTKFPGLAILITDLHYSLENLQQGIRYLQAKNLEIVVLQVLGQADFAPLTVFEDAELSDSESSEKIDMHFSQQSSEMLRKLIEDHSSACREYLSKQQIAFGIFKSNSDLLDSLRKSKQALKVIL